MICHIYTIFRLYFMYQRRSIANYILNEEINMSLQLWETKQWFMSDCSTVPRWYHGVVISPNHLFYSNPWVSYLPNNFGLYIYFFLDFLWNTVSVVKKLKFGVPIVTHQVKEPSFVSSRMRIQSLTLFSGLRIQHCCKLRCRLPTQLGSSITVAVV